MAGSHFDFIAGVLFNEDFTVMRAALIPHATALERSTYVAHTNSHRFLLRDSIWEANGVRDVTMGIAGRNVLRRRRNPVADTAIFLRAGASKAEGAPLQGVLFKQYFSSRIKTGTDRSSGRAGQWNRVGRNPVQRLARPAFSKMGPPIRQPLRDSRFLMLLPVFKVTVSCV